MVKALSLKVIVPKSMTLEMMTLKRANRKVIIFKGDDSKYGVSEGGDFKMMHLRTTALKMTI